MNTKTMRLPPRRVLTPDKRKERDGVVPVTGKLPETAVMKPPLPPIIPPVQSFSRKAPAKVAPSAATAEPAGSNQLLAGYLAHEFLTKGTLFGEQWNPVRAQTGPVEPRMTKPSHNTEPDDPSERKRRRYVEVANLLRADGTHLPGIVNPAQLARFLKL
ncbi:PREDICTED: uncharacterized protein LOC104826047 [Tarenaya hassleriana]|uniref:uncharacterized protein LOC104826047 n=1 Tax=Tarenaya hassleriana TaxID=28532 RepID=UPI00053CA47F|nr:PREDICTED: uncharacterized protein LOC104826047 [Tarenaya hassleriana]